MRCPQNISSKLSARKLQRDVWSSWEKYRSGVHSVSEPWQQLRSPRESVWKVWDGSWRNMWGLAEDERPEKSRKRGRREDKAGSEGHPNHMAPSCKF